jgi:hypothetical protein
MTDDRREPHTIVLIHGFWVIPRRLEYRGLEVEVEWAVAHARLERA